MNALLLVAESVSERNTKTRYPRSSELNVVVNNIEVGFRPDKYVVPYIKAQTASNVAQKMIAADKIGAATESGALQSGRVKTKAFRTDSGLQFRLRPFAQRRRIDCVNVIEK